MSTTHKVDMENFDDVMDSQEMVILDFWAEWCGPCKMLAPVFEELAKHNEDIYFGKVNTEQAIELAQAFQVKSIPTIMAFKRGELMFEKAGLLPPQGFEKLLADLRAYVPGQGGEEQFEQEPS